VAQSALVGGTGRVKHGFEISAIGLAAAAALCAAAPAAASEARAVLSVSAIVSPACQVVHRADARPAPQVACSTGAGFSTMTSPRLGDRPIERAAAILGAPVRSADGVLLTGTVQSADARQDEAQASQFLTITY
jgi:hypothetical protein